MNNYYYSNPDYAQDPNITATHESLLLAASTTSNLNISDKELDAAVFEGHRQMVDAVRECSAATQEARILEDDAYWNSL